MFLVKFYNEEDHQAALFGYPWVIAKHYLAVKQWEPNFDLFAASIDKTTAWVRIPFLPIKWYHPIFLNRLGNRLGKLVRVEETTESASWGKFARIYVELDLSKPLASKFKMRRYYKRLDYERLRLVCFKCIIYGHRMEDYTSGVEVGNQELPPNEVHDKEGTVQPVHVRPKVTDKYSL